MKWINKNNRMQLTREEYSQLEPFLLALGVRTRMTMIDSGIITVEAQNVYEEAMPIWADQRVKAGFQEKAEKMLTPDELNKYRHWL